MSVRMSVGAVDQHKMFMSQKGIRLSSEMR